MRIATIAIAAALLLSACAAPRHASRGTGSATAPSAGAGGSSIGARGAGPAAGASGDDLTLTDPCANRLHDLAGSLLLYYAVHHRLPEQIAELEQIAGPAAAGSLACPVSGQAYIYRPRGLLTPDTQSQIVLYDPAPSHGNRRWALTIVEPSDPNGALVTKVLLLPNAAFPPPAPAKPPTEPPSKAPAAE